VSGDINIGRTGTGTLAAQNGGKLSGLNGTVGTFTGSAGMVRVEGEGSSWTSSGDLTVGGDSTAAGGSGEVNILDNGIVEVGGTLKLWDQGRVNLDGGELRLKALPSGPGVFDWNAGRLTFTADQAMDTFTIAENGTLDLENVFLHAVNKLDFSRNSELDLNQGRLIHTSSQLQMSAGNRVTGAGDLFTGHAGLNLGQGGELAGSGAGLDLCGDLYGSGTVGNATVYGDVYVGNSPGIMEFTGVEFRSSTLYMEIAGSGQAGVDYDQVIFNGEIDLTGVVLNILFLDDFVPEFHDSFNLFDFDNATVTGLFKEIVLPGFDEGLAWDTSNLYTLGSLDVKAAPIPGPVWLLATGLIGLAGIRRKSMKG